MKKRFLIFALSFLIICGFILARDFYIIDKRATSHKHDCCSGCKKDEMCQAISICFPCCDKDNNIWNIILLKKKYDKTIEGMRRWLPCYDF